MQLQLALDLIDSRKAKQLLEEIVDLVDIVEIGTPLLMKEGVKAVTEIKNTCPALKVLADLKIVDAGDHEAKIGFDAGADIVSVLGAAHDITIRRALSQAHACNKEVMVDLIAVDDVQRRSRDLDGMGANYICVHTAYDLQAQGVNPLRELQLVQPVLRQARMVVAGGIKPETLPQIATYRPGIVIVGGFITSHPDPRQATLEIRELLG